MKILGFVLAISMAAIITSTSTFGAEDFTYESMFGVDTSSAEFASSIADLPNTAALIAAINDFQSKQAKPSGSATMATGSIGCTGGSGGWSCSGSISWEFGGPTNTTIMRVPVPENGPPPYVNDISAPATFQPADVFFAAQSIHESHPQSKASPDTLMSLGIFSGACWVSLGATRQCFDGFTADMCRQLGASTGGIVTFVPFGSC